MSWDYLTSLSGDDWRTISIVWQGILMTLVVVTGIYQLMAIRTENRKNRTLEICSRYDSPLSFECKRILHKARRNGELAEDPIKYRAEIAYMLGFFEEVAIGIKRGVYEEETVHDHLGGTLRQYVHIYLTGDIPIKARLIASSKTFENLLALADKWEKVPDAAILEQHALEIKRKPEAPDKQVANDQAATKDSA